MDPQAHVWIEDLIASGMFRAIASRASSNYLEAACALKSI